MKYPACVNNANSAPKIQQCKHLRFTSMCVRCGVIIYLIQRETIANVCRNALLDMLAESFRSVIFNGFCLK